MSAPTRYELSYDFTAFQVAHPTTPLPADKIEIEFNDLQTTTDDIIDNLALIQRSDGQLANNSVGADQLQDAISFGLNPVGDWTTATDYDALDGVFHGNNLYKCLIAHTSGVFATDLSANKWELLLNFDQFLSAASGSATASAASASAALTSETNAAASATSAAVSAISAKYTYKTSTSMANPSSGNIRFNNATIASVTAMAISANSADSGSPDISDFIATWDDSNSTIKGTLTIRKAGSPSTFAIFSVTGTVTDNSTWLQFSTTYVAGSGTLSADDAIFIGFVRTGDAGLGNVSNNAVTSFTKQQNFGTATLTSSSNHVAWNLDNAQTAMHTFTENTTLDNPTNMVDGGTYVLRLIQHASSPKTLAFGTAYKTPGGTSFVVSNTNSAIDILTFVSDGTNMYMVGQKAFA